MTSRPCCAAPHGHRGCSVLAAKRPLKTVLCISCLCYSMLLSVLTLTNLGALGKTWPSLTGHLPHHHAGTDHHHTPTFILMLTNGEQGRNSGCHKREEGNPRQCRRKVIKVILISALCCFYHSGQGVWGRLFFLSAAKGPADAVLFTKSPSGQGMFHPCPYFGTSFFLGRVSVTPQAHVHLNTAALALPGRVNSFSQCKHPGPTCVCVPDFRLVKGKRS